MSENGWDHVLELRKVLFDPLEPLGRPVGRYPLALFSESDEGSFVSISHAVNAKAAPKRATVTGTRSLPK